MYWMEIHLLNNDVENNYSTDVFPKIIWSNSYLLALHSEVMMTTLVRSGLLLNGLPLSSSLNPCRFLFILNAITICIEGFGMTFSNHVVHC